MTISATKRQRGEFVADGIADAEGTLYRQAFNLQASEQLLCRRA
ncbi:hypothetical protein [Pseudomonas sp.]